MKTFNQLIGLLILSITISALETRAATFIVSSNANDGAGSLRQAILDANLSGNPNDTIEFASNVRGTIVLTGTEIEINKPIGTNLTINGPGENALSVQTNLAFRVFRVQSGNISVSDLRISRGFSSGFPAGGGILVTEDANLTLENCSVTENSGGGVATLSSSSLTINNTTISGNNGGGIDGAGVLSISNSTISDNFGANNAGINWTSGTAALTNTTISGNRGIGSGGMNSNGTTTTILNSTIAENFGGNSAATHTGGLRIESGTVSLKNTIISDNHAFTPDIKGAIVSLGKNLIRDRTGGSGFIASDLPNGTNPKLGGFTNNGGTTYTFSLRSTSPAINNGNNSGAPATDQRGVARPQNGTVDIGAFETGSLSAAFGKLAFVSDRNGNREIYSKNVDGTSESRLTTNPASDEFPDWSPDGERIAFATDRHGNFEIYTMSLSGSDLVRLTNNSGDDSEPAWSPDGNRILFVRNGSGIFSMDATGLNQSAVPNTSDGSSPSWSPDGTQIVFACNNTGSAICKINADGTGRAPFIFTDALYFAPAWSPDGASIAFSIDFDLDPFIYFYSAHNPDIFRPMLNSSSGDEVVGFSPTFSPDGAKIADIHSNGDLFIRDADGGNPLLLIDHLDDGNSFQPDWFGRNTPVGTNVTAISGTNSVTFSGVTAPGGTTTAVPITPGTAGTLPGGFSFGAGLPAYEIATTATVSAPITVCLQVPSVTNPTTFNALSLFHNESGALVDRTASRDYAAKTICAIVSSLSPFAVAEDLTPTANEVSVSGRVLTPSGRAIARAIVSFTGQNGETTSVSTNSFGTFRFNGLHSGEVYLVRTIHKAYSFDPRVLTISEDAKDMNIVAETDF